MNNLISRKALLELIDERNRNTCNGSLSCLQMKRMVENIPTVVAVEMMRCKDCKFWFDNDCRNEGALLLPNEDDFCSYGERRSEE